MVADYKSEHSIVNLSRPMVDGKLRYQVKCSCGRFTAATSRREAEMEQKAHRKEQRRKGYAERQAELSKLQA